MRLPAFEDLSKEQDVILNLHLDGNYLVSGPPGTGKSVMALYRAQALTFDDRVPAVLMFSNVLQQYTAQAAADIKVEAFVTTYHKWLWNFWRKQFGSLPPTIVGNPYEPDWAEIAARFMSAPPSRGGLTDLIVDEGQDLPLSFHRIAQFIARNMTVFADENQRLVEANTTLREIEAAIDANEHHVLKRNYRNTAEIASVAASYYSGAPTGMPDPPVRHGDRPTLRRFGKLNDFVDFVARYLGARTNLSVGVACPNQIVQKKLVNRLEARNLPVPVQAYMFNDPAHKTLDFTRPAVTIVHYRSLKGLEFDTLFVPELQLVTDDPTSAATRMRFYVVMSRAREELHLSWSGEGSTPTVVGHLKGVVEEL